MYSSSHSICRFVPFEVDEAVNLLAEASSVMEDAESSNSVSAVTGLNLKKPMPRTS